jgi:hypothetical protein
MLFFSCTYSYTSSIEQFAEPNVFAHPIKKNSHLWLFQIFIYISLNNEIQSSQEPLIYPKNITIHKGNFLRLECLFITHYKLAKVK